MINRGSKLLALVLAATLAAPVAADIKKKDTIKSLENKAYRVKPSTVIVNSSELARENYRGFLDLVSDDPHLKAEAMRRLGDLELEAAEADQLASNIESLEHAGYESAVMLFRDLLERYPDFPRNDTVLYQLARAYEVAGDTDKALESLDQLVTSYPDAEMMDEIQFRRGEMLFLRKNYIDSEVAYQAVVDHGDESRFYEQSLYKLGWSQFKLAMHEDSLQPFFELLDRKLENIELGDGEEQLADLKRAERELVQDTFRVLSISFSYMDGAQSIDEFLAGRGGSSYDYVIYRNLGDLYLEKERYVDAAKTGTLGRSGWPF